MRRLYVLPKSVCLGQIQIGVQGSDAPAPSAGHGELPAAIPAGTPITIETHRLFHPLIGWHYIDLPGGMVLMCTSFAHNERYEDMFHAHPEVAILPNPTVDGNKMLKDHVGSASYKFLEHHLDALKNHATLGAAGTDTVIDLARKASAIHPEIRFRNVL